MYQNLPWKVVYLWSVLVDLNAITIKFALDDNILTMKLDKKTNSKKENLYQEQKLD